MKVIFFALILLLPTQAGLHFWPDFAHVFGIRIDYLSPTIYFTDLFVVSFTLFSFWENRRLLKRFPQLLYLVLLYLALNTLLVAVNQNVAIYKFLKIIELTIFGLAVYNSRQSLFKERFFHFLSFSLILTSLVGIIQFFSQKSIGGIFWWLGERALSVGLPGVSTVDFFGEERLRAYSTFSHPNSYAGFVLIGILFLYPWKTKLSKIALSFSVIGIVLSFSLTAISTALLIVVGLLVKKLSKSHAWQNLYYLIMVVVFSLSPLLLSPFSIAQEVTQRRDLLVSAFALFKNSPIFGVGLNNFIPSLTIVWDTTTRLLQPVHNIFELITVETGIFGLLLFCWILYLVLKRARNYGFLIWAILLTGSLDHYWLTLQQNQLLAVVVITYALSQELRAHYGIVK